MSGWYPSRDDAEPGAEATERADHLVAHEQHAVAVADLAHALEVAGRRHEATAGVLHRLEVHGGDRLRPLGDDHRLDGVGTGERVVGVGALRRLRCSARGAPGR